MIDHMPAVAQGQASLANDADLERDAIGFTNPNLHRRINSTGEPHVGEVQPRSYRLTVCGVDSIRTTQKHVHDEDSTTCEIP